MQRLFVSVLVISTAFASACGGDSDAGGDGLVGVDVRVSSSAARSCEMLVDDPDFAIADVAFADEVLGRSVPQGPRTAVTFLRQGDSPIADGSVRLMVKQSTGAGGLSVQAATCFDADGRTIDGDAVALAR